MKQEDFKLGMRVEVLPEFEPANWYLGKIVRIDTGTEPPGVVPWCTAHVRLDAGWLMTFTGPMIAGQMRLPPPPRKFAVGDRVEMRTAGDAWIPGVVVSTRGAEHCPYTCDTTAGRYFLSEENLRIPLTEAQRIDAAVAERLKEFSAHYETAVRQRDAARQERDIARANYAALDGEHAAIRWRFEAVVVERTRKLEEDLKTARLRLASALERLTAVRKAAL